MRIFLTTRHPRRMSGRRTLMLLHSRIARALTTFHRAIVRAKLRRLQSEMLFRKDYSDMLPPEQDATKFPQRPLVLGDKWDF